MSFFYAKTAISNVPDIIRSRPTKAFFDSLSLKTIYEKIIETTILSLSIGIVTAKKFLFPAIIMAFIFWTPFQKNIIK